MHSTRTAVKAYFMLLLALPLAKNMNARSVTSCQLRASLARVSKVLGAQAKSKPDITFGLVLRGDGRTEDGIPTYLSTFKSSNGHLLYEEAIEFSSPERSTEMLQSLLKGSEKIISRSPIVDQAGQRVGERLLIVVRQKPSNQPLTILALTHKSEYTAVSSESLDDLLEFEKKFLQLGKKPG